MKKITLVFVLLLFLFACDSLPKDPGSSGNPLDPTDPNYTPPQVTIIQGPEENEIVNSDTVLFTWEGNHNDMQFRYKMDNTDWSEYSDAISTTFTLLDDEAHRFEVQGKYLTGTESDPNVINFVVDAISPEAIFLYPRRITTITGSTFEVDLYVDVLDSIAIVSAKINFDPSKLHANNVTFNDASTNGFLLKHGGELISFSNINNSAGLVEIECAVYSGNPRNVSGTGKIAKIYFSHISGSLSNLNILNQSLFRNSHNEPVNINYFIGSEIVIN